MRMFMITLWVAMVMVTGYTLFNISYQVEALEGELAQLNREIRSEKEQIHNLQAEWTYTTRPDWLSGLSEQHLPGLQRLSPDQVLRIEDIPFARPDAPSSEAARLDQPLPYYYEGQAVKIGYTGGAKAEWVR